ncbi:hypothetical protein DRO60_02155 [Candidatus Bathyarchaeota archaeon]|nr:MAG: hypothetical protein DRO60_02155 [Candidatus Bathyarchaeota archaeon]
MESRFRGMLALFLLVLLTWHGLAFACAACTAMAWPPGPGTGAPGKGKMEGKCLLMARGEEPRWPR